MPQHANAIILFFVFSEQVRAVKTLQHCQTLLISDSADLLNISVCRNGRTYKCLDTKAFSSCLYFLNSFIKKTAKYSGGMKSCVKRNKSHKNYAVEKVHVM